MALQTVHIGLGPIGQGIVRAAATTGVAQPVLLVDKSPKLAERFAGEFMQQIPVWLAEQPVMASIDEAWAWVEASSVASPTVAVLATGSHLPDVADQIFDLINRKLNVVSTCEELTYPWLRNPQLADEIDAAARDAGVTVLGTGVNPGFVMDLLPSLAARAAINIRGVHVERVVDARRRRRQLQQKVGAGMRPDDFEQLVREGRIGHVGLAESAALIAEALGLEWDGAVQEEIRPVVAETDVSSEEFAVQAGYVRGVEQTAQVSANGTSVVLRLRMALGEQDEYDRAVIDAEPPVDMTVRPGLHGDQATVACVVNCIEAVHFAQPGLLTVLDLPVARRWPTRRE